MWTVALCCEDDSSAGDAGLWPNLAQGVALALGFAFIYARVCRFYYNVTHWEVLNEIEGERRLRTFVLVSVMYGPAESQSVGALCCLLCCAG